MSAWTQHIKSEIANISELLLARQKNGAPIAGEPDSSSFASKLIGALCQQIIALKDLSSGDAAGIETMLAATALDAGSKRLLSEAIEHRLSTGSAVGPIDVGTTGQHLLYPCAYMTAEDFTFIDDPAKAVHAKVQYLVDVLNKCGCIKLSEKTVRWWIAVLVSRHFSSCPTYESIHVLVIAMKEISVSCRQPFPFALLKEFPTTPEGLTQAHKNHSYPDMDRNPPITMVIPGLADIAAKIPMRSNSKLLKGTASHSSSNVLGTHGAPDDMLRNFTAMAKHLGFSRSGSSNCLEVRKDMISGNTASPDSRGSQQLALKYVEPCEKCHKPKIGVCMSCEEYYCKRCGCTCSVGDQRPPSLDRSQSLSPPVKDAGDDGASSKLTHELPLYGGVAKKTKSEGAATPDVENKPTEADAEDVMVELDIEEATLKALQARNSKVKADACKKPSAAVQAKKPAAALKVKPAASAKVKKPSFTMEWSRGQVQCRDANGVAHALKFVEHGGVEKARHKAMLWLTKELKKTKKA
jgi:hypothetical protein